MHHNPALLVLGLAAGAAACEPAPLESSPRQAAPLQTSEELVVLDLLEPAPLEPPTRFLEAGWGEAEGSFRRERVAARTGPMALAAEPDGGLCVIDTVGARLYRYSPEGRLRQTVALPLATADDVAVQADGSFAVLAFVRQPVAGYDVIAFDAAARPRSRVAAPQAATLPTALVADRGRFLVEQRHGQLHATDGSPLAWGRPAGDVLVRVVRRPEGTVEVTARGRDGRLEWSRLLVGPGPVTEVLAQEASGSLVFVVLRFVAEESAGDGAGHESWLVALSAEGAPLGKQLLQDSRVTDAGRPVAVAPSGDVFELTTSEAGVTVLRYAWRGAP